MKKIISFLFVVCLLVVCLPLSASAGNSGDIERFTTIASGYEHSLVIKNDNSLWAWGNNTFGQLGDGTVTAREFPVKIMDNVISVAAELDESYAIKADGTLWAWGRNSGTFKGSIGTLGFAGGNREVTYHYTYYSGDEKVTEYSTATCQDTPKKIKDNVIAISCNLDAAFVVDRNHDLWVCGWGAGAYSSESKPGYKEFKLMSDVAAVSVGDNDPFALILKTDGTVWSIGGNSKGQLGTGNISAGTVPVKVLDDAISVCACDCYSYAIKKDNSLWAWGYNGYGQLGFKSEQNENQLAPVKVMSNVYSVAGHYHPIAITTDGAVWDMCGYDTQLRRVSDTPNLVMKDGVLASAGFAKFFVVKKDGTLWTWGNHNYEGELGATINYSNPVKLLENVMLPNNLTPADTSPTLDTAQKITFPFRGTTLTMDWDMNWLAGDATAYQDYHGDLQKLAVPALALSNAVEEGWQNAQSLLDDLDFEEIKHANYEKDIFTSPAITVAKSKEKINGKTVMAIVVRGTNNFADFMTDIYSLGNGFRPSAKKLYNNVVKRYVDEYLSDVPKEDRILFITGHSLGGAMSGLLATMVEDIAEKQHTFVYTFASPNYNPDGKIPSNYPNVNNIINDEDVVPKVPKLDNMYYKVGRQYRFDLTSTSQRTEFEAAYYKITGKTYTAARKESGVNGIINRHLVQAYMAMLLCDLPTTEAKEYFVYQDVSVDAYYADAVLWAAEKGVTSGTSDTSFSPNAPCTRAQAVTFLWRAAGSPKPASNANPFTDVKAGQYYTDAVLWAVEKGITSGTSATAFSPNATCSRAQIVAFQYRAAGSPSVSNNVTGFTDVSSGQYYENAVKWAVEKEVTAGTSATTFSPNANCTRGQIVTFLYRDMGKS